MTTLGKYELHEQLGKGGFGTVYRATDNIGREVAIKVLKPGYADDADVIGRFRKEALAAGSLFHSQIATILDFGESDGRLYIVMRYINGQSLDKVIKEKGKLPWNKAVEIVRQIGEALDFAHQKGFIHRDIKPGNIIISPTDGAVLTDFGLVKAATSSGLSTTSVMMGTPAYIAPEIWSGKSATPATDVYSLACVFYEMLTGRILFDGESTPEIMKKHFDPVEIRENEIPVPVIPVLSKALSKDGKNRYQDFKSLLGDFPPFFASAREMETKKQVEQKPVINSGREFSGHFSKQDKNNQKINEEDYRKKGWQDPKPLKEKNVQSDYSKEKEKNIQQRIKAIFSKKLSVRSSQIIGIGIIGLGIFWLLTNLGIIRRIGSSLSLIILIFLVGIFLILKNIKKK